jgi:hypothetical protein
LKRFAALVFLLASPASATLYDYKWTGSVDRGEIDATEVSGSFRYDDAAPVTWDYEGAGPEIQLNAISNIQVLLGNHFYALTGGAWDGYRTKDGRVGFNDVGLDNSDNRLWWGGDGWTLNVLENGSVKEIGGRIVSFYRTGWVPDIGDGDSAPVPEPSSLVLLSTALLAFAGYRKTRSHRR